ncbi:NAD(P)-binding protein [Pisolithus croceorrhizus]|nr:NAD(P)-binding protein [Pisolithus croceorrhizus]
MQPIDDRPAHSPLSESSYTLKVGWYGLGAMGYFMARNIATSGRAASPILVIGTSAAIVASSPAQLVTECDVIFTNLSTNEVVQHVYSDLAKILSKSLPTESKIFVDTSTISPSLAVEIDKLLISLSRCHFVASPIIGPPAAADKKVAHLLIPVGRKILDVGGNVERAPTLKLVCNGMLMSANELLAEVLTLGEKSGIGAQAVYNLMKGAPHGCQFRRSVDDGASLIIYGDRMLNQHFDGTKGIAIDLGVSVLNDVCRLAVELNCPMPTIDIAHQSLVTARSIHEHLKQTGTNRWDVLDCSALIASRRVSAGLEPFESDNHRVTHED